MGHNDENEPEYIEWSEESDRYIAEFLSGRNLSEYRSQEVKRREEHDKSYQKYVRNDQKRPEQMASKRFREDLPNKQSKCDSQFVNNLHTYRTCDGGSGYRAEQKHYAVDFVLDKNAPDLPKLTTDLKKLKVVSKNKSINDWMDRQSTVSNFGIRRAVSCMDLSTESLGRDEKKERELRKDRLRVRYYAYLICIDPEFLPGLFGLDTSRLFYALANAFAHLIPRISAQQLREGEIKISKVLFGTEDLFAYVIPESFNKRQALLNFSSEYKRLLSQGDARTGIRETKTSNFFQYVNVVLFLEEYIEDKTQFRRARHICVLPFDPYVRKDLYLELDTGELRVVATSTENVHILTHMWTHFPIAILEVRFQGAKTHSDVSKHIKAIRDSGRALITSIEKVDRESYFNQNQNYNSYYKRKTNYSISVMLKTYKEYSKPQISTLFCEDPDCRGMCSTDVYFRKPKQVSNSAPAHEKLTELRGQFTSKEVLRETQYNLPLSAYILPVNDAHNNERTPDHYGRLKFLSGFDGTKGIAIITLEKAILWTDNQHFKLAQREVDMNYWMVKNSEERNADTMGDWIIRNIPAGSSIGFDPSLLSVSHYQSIAPLLKPLNIELVALSKNLVDNFWANRPFRQGDVVQVMGLDDCGKTAINKILELRKELRARKCIATVVSSLDDVMWLLNIRGNDLEFSPLAYSYLFVTQTETHLFIDREKLDMNAQSHLNRASTNYHSYRKVHSFLTEWFDTNRMRTDCMVLLTPETSYSIASIFEKQQVVTESSIVQKIKSRKNPMELSGMRASNIRHSVAIVEFLHWIQKEAINGRRYTEARLVQKLEEFKTADGSYVGASLPTIFSSGENSSDMHHKPVSSLTVVNMQQFLLESGGQYKNGTTLATRTVWDSEKTEEFASHYTLVLKGLLQVANAKFPGLMTQGSSLDVLARNALWSAGLDFDHEAGHSVGHFLNVREMPGYQSKAEDSGILAGQVITIEPGYFKKDQYGIQIGNCYETVATSTENKVFLEFKPLTLVPILTSIIVKNLLTADEILWLNKYHYTVFAQIGSVLRDEKKLDVLKWLQEACQPI